MKDTDWENDPHFIGRKGSDFMPINLKLETVKSLAYFIAVYRNNGFPADANRIFLGLMKFWLTQLLTGQNLARLTMFETYTDSLMPPLMSEMEFLLHQEIVSRQIGYATYSVPYTELFNQVRMDVERWCLPKSFTSLKMVR